MTQSRPRVFPGWWVVLASAFGLFLGPVPIVVLSFGVFLKPFVQEFHSSRAAVSFAFTLHNLVFAAGLPFAGRLVDRFGARKVILPATVLVGLTLLASNFCFRRIWQLYLLYIIFGLAGSGAGPVPYSDLVSCWFNRRRGLALGLTMFGLGAGAFVMPALAQKLIGIAGWRFAFSIFGAAILVFTVPVVATFLKEKPGPMLAATDGLFNDELSCRGTDDHRGLTLNQARRTGTFWVLLSAYLLLAASMQACFTHIVPVLADRGTPARAAALAASVCGAGLLVGRTGSGYLLDRFFAPRAAALIFGVAGAGIAVLWSANSQGLGLTAAFMIGMGLGSEGDVMAYLTSRYFGLRSFGQIYGYLFAGFVLAGGFGAYLMGAAFDAHGSYTFALGLCCIIAFTGGALILTLGPYPYGPAFLTSLATEN